MKNTKSIKIFVTITACIIALTLTSCGTVKGVGSLFGGMGKDLVDGSNWMQDHLDNGFKRLDERTK